MMPVALHHFGQSTYAWRVLCGIFISLIVGVSAAGDLHIESKSGVHDQNLVNAFRRSDYESQFKPEERVHLAVAQPPRGHGYSQKRRGWLASIMLISSNFVSLAVAFLVLRCYRNVGLREVGKGSRRSLSGAAGEDLVGICGGSKLPGDKNAARKKRRRRAKRKKSEKNKKREEERKAVQGAKTLFQELGNMPRKFRNVAAAFPLFVVKKAVPLMMYFGVQELAVLAALTYPKLETERRAAGREFIKMSEWFHRSYSKQQRGKRNTGHMKVLKFIAEEIVERPRTAALPTHVRTSTLLTHLEVQSDAVKLFNSVLNTVESSTAGGVFSDEVLVKAQLNKMGVVRRERLLHILVQTALQNVMEDYRSSAGEERTFYGKHDIEAALARSPNVSADEMKALLNKKFGETSRTILTKTDSSASSQLPPSTEEHRQSKEQQGSTGKERTTGPSSKDKQREQEEQTESLGYMGASADGHEQDVKDQTQGPSGENVSLSAVQIVSSHEDKLMEEEEQALTEARKALQKLEALATRAKKAAAPFPASAGVKILRLVLIIGIQELVAIQTLTSHKLEAETKSAANAFVHFGWWFFATYQVGEVGQRTYVQLKKLVKMLKDIAANSRNEETVPLNVGAATLTAHVAVTHEAIKLCNSAFMTLERSMLSYGYLLLEMVEQLAAKLRAICQTRLQQISRDDRLIASLDGYQSRANLPHFFKRSTLHRLRKTDQQSFNPVQHLNQQFAEARMSFPFFTYRDSQGPVYHQVMEGPNTGVSQIVLSGLHSAQSESPEPQTGMEVPSASAPQPVQQVSAGKEGKSDAAAKTVASVLAFLDSSFRDLGSLADDQ